MWFKYQTENSRSSPEKSERLLLRYGKHTSKQATQVQKRGRPEW